MERGLPDSVQRRNAAVEVRRPGSGVVVAISGELDHHSADLLRESLDSCLAEGCGRIVIDCSGLEFCDSTGLNVLLGARLSAEDAGGVVALAAMRPAVARVFEVTGADSVFPVHDTVDEALADIPSE
ncbi:MULTISPECIES: STAS domain-containing protein [unclassified Streptomyces]|uniref:STAS domain-containing protein n=1 Tax=unclassified Streptomyces TaxID=2593676 RepID=UPI000CD54125|nr:MULTISPECIES: STAS domain-containing protein [unclassified Streptomyces]